MKLSKQLLLTLVVAVLLYAGLSCIVLDKIVYTRFETIEKDEAQKNLQRCVDAMHRELYHLVEFTRDWAWWDDTVEFVTSGSDTFIKNNVSSSTLKDCGVNLIYFCRNDGTVVWRYCAGSNGKELDLPQLPSDRLSSNHVLMTKLDGRDCDDSIVSGIYITDYKPLLVAAIPVLPTSKDGYQAGVLIMGKFIDEELIRNLSSQVNVPFTVSSMTEMSANFNKAEALSTYDDRIEASEVLKDIDGRGGMLLTAVTSRQIMAQGRGALYWSMLCLFVAASVSIIIVIVSLRYFVVKPVANFIEHVMRVAQTDNLTARIKVSSKNELGTLAESFNHMMDQLQGARIQLLEKSYHYGKSEQAADMLQNMRNVLTPFFSKLNLLDTKLNSCSIANLKMAYQQLQDPDISDDRKSDLQQYFDLAYGKLLENHSSAQRQLREICSRTRNIEEFFDSAGSVTHAQPCNEILTLEQLIANARKMVSDELACVFKLEDSEIKNLPVIKTDVVTVSNIFGNLIANGAQSIRLSKVDDGLITVKAQIEGDGDRQLLHVIFVDNGTGIAPDAIEHLFDRDFATTQLCYLGCLGLNWCADSAKEMGGRIWIESDGLGKGARAHVVIPVVVCEQADLINV